MSKIVDAETMKQATEALKGLTEVAKSGTTALVDETIKLYIFYGVMGIIKAAVVFVVFAVVMKFLTAIDAANETPSKTIKSLKTCAIVLSLVYFTIQSMPHILDIGKAMVAPNIFIAEKANDLLKKE